MGKKDHSEEEILRVLRKAGCAFCSQLAARRREPYYWSNSFLQMAHPLFYKA